MLGERLLKNTIAFENMPSSQHSSAGSSSRLFLPLILFGLGMILVGAGTGIQILEREHTSEPGDGATYQSCVDPAQVTFQAPELEFQTLNGQPAALEQFSGQVVLLNAWATWCPPCLKELPTLEAYYNKYSEAGFVLVGINIGESRKSVQDFLEQTPLGFPIWLDPGETTLRALSTYSLPYSIVIDRAGTVRLAWSGATCFDNLETAVTPIIMEQTRRN